MMTLAQQYWDYVFLLNLGSYSGEPLDNLKIQKLTFISEDTARQREKLKAANFSFFRYNQGPYSKELADAVRELESLGFVDPETRKPTERGRYILDYVREFVKESQPAQHALRILGETCKKYKRVKSSKLVNIVYGMKVPVAQFNGKIMRVRDIPKHVDIICPGSENLFDFSVFPQEIVEDLQTEFSLTPEDISPDNPHNISAAQAALDAAIAR